MKPSDFFIGSREFFGALVPGIIWLAATVLIFINASIHKMLIYASSTNLVGALSFAGLALLVGTLLQSRSFKLSRMVHRFLTDAEQSRSKYPRMNRFFQHRFVKLNFGEFLAPLSYRSAILQQVENRIQTAIKSADPDVDRERFDGADQLYQYERHVFATCKRSVLARSPELGRLLKEKEVEVNLIGTLPLPLFFFALGLLLRTKEISELPVIANHQPWLWTFGIVVLAVVTVSHLLLRFHASRKEEVRMCLESFLLIEYGMAENRKSNEPIAVDAGGE